MEWSIDILFYAAAFADYATRFPKAAEDIAYRLQLIEDLGKVLWSKQNTLPRNRFLDASRVTAIVEGLRCKPEPRTIQTLNKEIAGEVQLANAGQMAGGISSVKDGSHARASRF